MKSVKLLGSLLLAAAVLYGIWMAWGGARAARGQEAMAGQHDMEYFRKGAATIEAEAADRAEKMDRQLAGEAPEEE